jgi:hypothetical protein
VLAILFGVFPHFFLLRYMDETIDRQVNELAVWTENVKEAEEQEAESQPAVSLSEDDGDKLSFAGGTLQSESDTRLAGRIPHQTNVDTKQERLSP